MVGEGGGRGGEEGWEVCIGPPLPMSVSDVTRIWEPARER